MSEELKELYEERARILATLQVAQTLRKDEACTADSLLSTTTTTKATFSEMPLIEDNVQAS
jgi:hypothetical protein